MSFKERIKRIEEQRENLEAWKTYYAEVEPRVIVAVDQLEAALKGLHLIIPPEGWSARPTGDGQTTETKPDQYQQIRIEISAISDGKFKFLKDQGYDSRGRGRNQDALDAKAAKMHEKLKEALPADAEVQVNCFSLELHERGRVNGPEKTETKRVLITMWIR